MTTTANQQPSAQRITILVFEDYEVIDVWEFLNP